MSDMDDYTALLTELLYSMRAQVLHEGTSTPVEQPPTPSQPEESQVDVSARDILALEEMEQDIVQRHDFLVCKRKALDELKKLEQEEKKLKEKWRVSYAVIVLSLVQLADPARPTSINWGRPSGASAM